MLCNILRTHFLGHNLLQYVILPLGVSFSLSYLLCVCAFNWFVRFAAAESTHDGTAVGLSCSHTPKANSHANRNVHVEVRVADWRRPF